MQELYLLCIGRCNNSHISNLNIGVQSVQNWESFHKQKMKDTKKERICMKTTYTIS